MNLYHPPGLNMAVISLRGWHPAIARAEAEAMFGQASITRGDSRRLLIAEGDCDWEKAEIMSGTECVLIDGGICDWTSLDDLLSQIKVEKTENMAVVCWRHEGKIPIGTKEIERAVGGKFHRENSTFNLQNPSKRFGVVLDASAGLVAWGWMVGQGPGKHGWSSMRANNRPFFRPVSLEPRLARAAVNIAAGTNQGLVVDPMCGTGGILIESGWTKRKTLGVDFDPEMVIGTKANLEWAGVEAVVERGDSTRYEFPADICAVVVDPPYGRNSQPSESKLLVKTLENLRVRCGDFKLVLIIPCSPELANLDEEIKPELELFGFEIIAAFGIPVHKSLARKMIIATTLPLD